MNLLIRNQELRLMQEDLFGHLGPEGRTESREELGAGEVGLLREHRPPGDCLRESPIDLPAFMGTAQTRVLGKRLLCYGRGKRLACAGGCDNYWINHGSIQHDRTDNVHPIQAT